MCIMVGPQRNTDGKSQKGAFYGMDFNSNFVKIVS